MNLEDIRKEEQKRQEKLAALYNQHLETQFEYLKQEAERRAKKEAKEKFFERPEIPEGEIFPCPFCARESNYRRHLFVQVWNQGSTKESYSITCEFCECIGPDKKTISEAVERWNRRAHPDNIKPLETEPEKEDDSEDLTDEFFVIEDFGRLTNFKKLKHVLGLHEISIERATAYIEHLEEFKTKVLEAIPEEPKEGMIGQTPRRYW